MHARSRTLRVALACACVGALVAHPALAGTASLDGTAATVGAARSIVTALNDLLGDRALEGARSPCSVDVRYPNGVASSTTCAGDAPGAGAAASTADEVAGDLRLESEGTVLTPRGHPSLASLPAAGDDALVRVHAFGDVTATGPDGAVVWTRSGRSFYDDWGLPPRAVPLTLAGSSPFDPFVAATERAFAVADLDGDGAEEVAVAHFIYFQPGDVIGLSAVTVLEGATGRTLWSRLFPGFATQLLAVGRTLIAGIETGPRVNRIGEDGTTSHMLGIRFAGEAFSATEVWTHDLQLGWARWLAAEPRPDGRVAVAWTAKALGAPGPAGRVMLLDPETGARVWEVQTPGYPRMLRHDPTTGDLVALEQADPVVSAPGGYDLRFDYVVTSRSAADGSPSWSTTREDAVGLTLEVANLAGPSPAEVVVADAVISDVPADSVLACEGDPLCPSNLVLGSRLAVLGADGAPVWSNVRPTGDHAHTFDVVAAGNDIVAASIGPAGDLLERFDGATGAIEWRRTAGAPYPLFVFEDPGEPTVLGATRELRLRRYDLSDGSIRLDEPLLAEIVTADAGDVGGDAIDDLVVGTMNGVVWALDGGRLDDTPDVLWRAEVGDRAHEVQLVDLDGDGRDEVVVAAVSSVRVLDAATGAARYAIDSDSGLVWSVTIGDVDGDGAPDLLVPTETLAAHRGPDGALLWEHDPVPGPASYFSTPAITPAGNVVAQYANGAPARTEVGAAALSTSRMQRVVVGIDGATGAVQWRQADAGFTVVLHRWESVVSDPAIAGAGGYGVATSHEAWTGPGGLSGFPRPKVDVYDARTGELAWSAGYLEGASTEMGMAMLGGRLAEFGWSGMADLTPAGTTHTSLGSVSDATVADLGPTGRVLLTAWADVDAYPLDALTGARGNRPAPLASWGGVMAGAVRAHDVDGDAVDEVLVWKFNWNAYAESARPLGVFVGQGDYLPHGIAVLAARA